MTIADCKPGDVVEVIYETGRGLMSTGRTYKIGKPLANGTQTRATYGHSQDVALLANNLMCRLVTKESSQ